MNGHTVEIRELSYRYPDGTTALDGLTFSIPLGRRTAILGANGCGKSTLLRHLNGLILPQSGSIAIDGREINKKIADEIRKTVGLLFDNPDNQLFSPSVEADVGFGPSNLRMARDEVDRRSQRAMERVNILDLRTRSPYNLSLGQKKRCAIAGVLAMEPRILLMDEPFSGLDPSSLASFLKTLDELYHGGMTQIMSTHDVDLAYEWADQVIILSKGKLLASGSREIMRDEELMRSANLTAPLLVRLFEGTGRIPECFDEARRMVRDSMMRKEG